MSLNHTVTSGTCFRQTYLHYRYFREQILSLNIQCCDLPEYHQYITNHWISSANLFITIVKMLVHSKQTYIIIVHFSCEFNPLRICWLQISPIQLWLYLIITKYCSQIYRRLWRKYWSTQNKYFSYYTYNSLSTFSSVNFYQLIVNDRQMHKSIIHFVNISHDHKILLANLCFSIVKRFPAKLSLLKQTI